jgi:hypothetical protein
MKQLNRTALGVAAAVAALAVPAFAQQTPGPDGTNANGPITLLYNYVAETTPMRVMVNGHSVDHLKTAAYDDITTSVHTGSNTMTIRWDGPVDQIHVKISYAPTRNNFKNVVEYTASAAKDGSLKGSGSKVVTFTIPG